MYSSGEVACSKGRVRKIGGELSSNNHEWSNDIGPVRMHIHQPNLDLQATGERGLWLWGIETFRVCVCLLSLSHEVISGARLGADPTIPIDG